MAPVRGTRLPSSRRAPAIVAAALTVVLTGSGLAWADLAPRASATGGTTATAGSAGLAAPAASAGQNAPQTAAAQTAAAPAVAAPSAPAGDAAQPPVAEPVPAAVAQAVPATVAEPGCAAVDGLPVCAHDHGDAHVAAATAARSPAPAVRLSCDGDGRSGNRVQVIYVHRTDAPDRLASVLPALRRHVEVANGVFARSSDGQRRLRVVTDAGCQAAVERVALTPAQTASFAETTRALRGAGRTAVDRKYLLFVDDDAACGLAEQFHDDRASAANRNNDGNAFAVVHRRCWTGVLAAHEVVHMLGGVQASAPRSTGHSGHCVDQQEVMCYPDGSGHTMSARCTASHASLLDCGRDDYFAVAPAPGSYLATHWNTANSSFLIGGGPAVPTRPSAPTAVTSSRSDDRVTVGWGAPEQMRSGVAGFDVVDLDNRGAVLATVGGTARSAVVALAPLRSYRLAVVAHNEAGRSAPAGGHRHMAAVAPQAPRVAVSTTPPGPAAPAAPAAPVRPARPGAAGSAAGAATTAVTAVVVATR